MTLPGMGRALLSRWYITVPGIMLSLVLAAIVSIVVPRQYSSTGTAVLLQPPIRGKDQAATNPLLNFDSSLSTNALILVQALDNDDAAAQLGLPPGGTESYTIDDVAAGSADSSGGSFVQPFVYVTSKSATPRGAVTIVTGVFQKAAADLAGRQRAEDVPTRSAITLSMVVSPSEPKLVLPLLAGAVGAALVAGLCLSLLSVLAVERFARRRALRRATGERRERELSATAVPLSPTPRVSPDEQVAQRNGTVPPGAPHVWPGAASSLANGGGQ